MYQQIISKFKNLNAPILIQGETGTGKSKIAKSIFDASSIHKEKFITMHLACIKEELFESELFGHKKGSFTGANENKNGYLKETATGTLFLDEIGELSLEAQKKLLYLLEEKSFVPVGEVNATAFRGRLLFATNKNLKKMVREGQFRADLYFRLMIFQIELAPLRLNTSFVKEQLNDYLQKFKIQYKKELIQMDSELEAYLINYSWPGNIRELKNCIEGLVALSDHKILKICDLPDWIATHEVKENVTEIFLNDYTSAINAFEEKYLRARLLEFGGRINETAREIKISKVNLINKAKKYHINTLEMRYLAQSERVQEVA